jgi:hypothetical protein
LAVTNDTTTTATTADTSSTNERAMMATIKTTATTTTTCYQPTSQSTNQRINQYAIVWDRWQQSADV